LEFLNHEQKRPIDNSLHVTQTLPLAEAIHRALIARAARGQVISCPELVGQDRSGQPLSGQHGHAKILPVDLDQDGLLDHVIIHASMGLGEAAQQAIRSLRVLRYQGGSCVSLRVVTADRPGCCVAQSLFPGISGADIWTSLTPLIPPRFLKKSGKNSLQGQIDADLASRGLPATVSIEVLDEASQAMRGFVRRRQEGKLAPPQNVGFALRLNLSEPIEGPLALGYASHFGLGLFVATGI